VSDLTDRATRLTLEFRLVRNGPEKPGAKLMSSLKPEHVEFRYGDSHREPSQPHSRATDKAVS